MKTGILYGVGVGPGDPGLLTRRAVETIERCGVIAYPVTQSGQRLARDIAAAAVDLTGKTELPLPFAMGREAPYDVAAARIVPYLAAGRDVALLNLGDLSLYATGTRLLRRLAARGYETEIIPGVTSVSAAAARLGTALAEGDESLHILPGAIDAADALALPGTKVFLKSGRELPELLRALSERGAMDHAMLVKNCGLPGEAVFPNLAAAELPEDLGYFVTVIVKE